jgi:hypothetical protein
MSFITSAWYSDDFMIAEQSLIVGRLVLFHDRGLIGWSYYRPCR